MKNLILLLCLFIVATYTGNAQTGNRNSAGTKKSASTGIVFIENQGQLKNTDGLPANDVQYYSIMGSPKTFISQNAISYVIAETPPDPDSLPKKLQRIDVSFKNEAHPKSDFSQIIPSRPFQGKFNYIKSSDKAKWQTQLTGYTQLSANNVIPEIDVVMEGNEGAMQCHIKCKAGTDLSKVLMEIEGADFVQVNTQGALVIGTHKGNMVQTIGQPTLTNPGGQIVAAPFAVKFVQISTTQVGFKATTPIPANRPFTIPFGLQKHPFLAQQSTNGVVWSTFLPGDISEVMNDIQADDFNNVFVTGLTSSSNFPVGDGVLNPYQMTLSGDIDVVVAKFDKDNILEWMTYFGGVHSDVGQSIIYTSDKHIYITGQTESADFPIFKPVGSSAFQQISYGFANDLQSAYISRFDPQTGMPDWSTAFGVGDDVVPTSMDFDSDNNIYIAGVAGVYHDECIDQCGDNPSPCFPVCNNVGFAYYQDFHAEGDAWCPSGVGLYADGFIARFNPDAELEYSSFFGGGQDDFIRDLVINRSTNQLYITGVTESDLATDNPCGVESPTWPAGFPLCNPGSNSYFDDDFDGDLNRNCGFGDIYNSQGFISRIDLNTGQLAWSTYFGGNGIDGGHSLAINSQGDVYITGYTTTNIQGDVLCGVPNNQGFPNCHPGQAYSQGFQGGITDHYIARFNSSGQLMWSTFLGGNLDETITALTGDPSVTIDAQDFVYVTGATKTDGSSFPLQQKSGLYYQANNADGNKQIPDAYMVSFDTDNQLTWGTYFGGSGQQAVTGKGDHAIRAYVSQNQQLYILGTTASNKDFPAKCNNPEFCYDAPTILAGENPNDPYTAQDVDGFIAKFDLTGTAGFEKVAYQQENLKLQVYPVPTSSFVTIDFEAKYNEQYTLSLVNTLGQTSWQEQLPLGSNHVTKQVDISVLPNGLYFIVIESQQSINIKRIVLQ